MAKRLRTYLNEFNRTLPPFKPPLAVTPKREPTMISRTKILSAIAAGESVLVSRDVWNEILEELNARK